MGIVFYDSLLKWIVSLIGIICIVLIMMGSTKRLEHAQDERYGRQPEYQKYVRAVPVLFPFVPVYTLKNIRVYLE
jgi:steroid 5-alpha reductase family enzyme